MPAPNHCSDATHHPQPPNTTAVQRLGRMPWLRAALLAWASHGGAVHAQIVDPAFTPSFNADVHVVAACPGVRTLVGGDFWVVNGQTLSGLVRLMPNGTLDPTFNVDITGPVLSLAVQLDGRILVGGNFD